MENSENEKFNNDKMDKGEKEDENEETKVSRRRNEMRRRQEELMKRGEQKDFLRRLFVERHEAEQEETLIRAQEARELKLLQAQQTQKLGEELMRRKNDEMREQKLRQLLRNDSIELRRLEDQLRGSYAAKAAQTQLRERVIRRENSKIREIEDDRMIQGWYKDDRFEKQQMLEARLKKERYQRDLQEQLVSNHRLRQQKIEAETRHERKLVEDTLTLGIEDRENRRRKRDIASNLLAEQRAFIEAREFRKSRENQAMLMEQEERARILADKMMRENQSSDTKSTMMAAKEAILEKMMENMLNKEITRRERENATNELIAEKEKNYLENLEREKIVAKNRRAREMLEDMERQKMAKEDGRAREAKIDREFAEYLEKEREKFLIDDKRKLDERRAKAIEYGKDLKEAIATGSLSYAKDILENQAVVERDRMIEEERRKAIEEERSRMLREHETHLRGFFNSGIEMNDH